MLRSTTDPVNPTRTVFDVESLLWDLDSRVKVFKMREDKSTELRQYDTASHYKIRFEICGYIADLIRSGKYEKAVEEVPAPESCGCIDKAKITDRITNRIEREQMWEKQHADNYVYLQAGVCRENARTLTKLLQEINEGDFDLPAPNLTTCDGGPVRECRCSPAQLVELLRQRAGASVVDIPASDLYEGRYFWMKIESPEKMIVIRKGERS